MVKPVGLVGPGKIDSESGWCGYLPSERNLGYTGAMRSFQGQSTYPRQSHIPSPCAYSDNRAASDGAVREIR